MAKRKIKIDQLCGHCGCVIDLQDYEDKIEKLSHDLAFFKNPPIETLSKMFISEFERQKKFQDNMLKFLKSYND